MPVAPERGDVVGGLRRVVHGELIAAGKRTEEILGEDATGINSTHEMLELNQQRYLESLSWLIDLEKKTIQITQYLHNGGR